MKTMTKSLFAVLVMAAATAGANRPAEAAHWWPWCSRYATRADVESCAFSSYAQCMQTVSGIGGTCYRNRYPAPGARRRG